MKKITAQSEDIRGFISRDTYKIPIYQRGYSWTNENVEVLLNDLNDNEEHYFIGNVLLATENDEINIVDGQQRLTTIFLILLALYDQFYRLSEEEEDKEIFFNIKQEYTAIAKSIGLAYHDTVDGEQTESLHLQLLEEDQQLLNACIQFVQSDKENQKPKYANRKLVRAFLNIKSYLENDILQAEDSTYMMDTKEQFIALKTFENKVMKAIILPIELDELSDVFAVFSSMNSKGQSLTIVDLLKADVLACADDGNEIIQMWKELTDTLAMGSGELSITHANRFLQNNYDTFYLDNASSITAKEALSKYRDLIKTRQNDIKDLIQELQNNARLYALIAGDYRNQKIFKNLVDTQHPILKLLDQTKALDIKSAYPILFFVLDLLRSHEISEQECEDVIRYIIHFYVRRNVIKRPKSSNLRSAFLKMIRSAEKEDLGSKKVAIILDELRKLAYRELDDATFIDMLSKSMYSENQKLTRFLLISLERDAMKRGESNYFNKQNPDNLDEMVSKKTPRWTIEHIFPQDDKLSHSWRDMIQEEDDIKAKEKHDQYKDKLGNLTLTGYNSEMSNHAFVEKRDQRDRKTGDYVGYRTPLYLNKTIFGNVPYEDKNTWTPTDIDRRTKELAERLSAIYSI